MQSATNNDVLERVRQYWDTNLNGMQFCSGKHEPGSSAFFEEIRTERYSRFPYIIELIARHSAKVKGQHLLEIGCGLGTDLLEWRRRGWEVSGIDLSPGAVDMARRNFGHASLVADIRVGNAEVLPFSDAQFDLVYSFGVLHHTPDTQEAIGETWRVLKPGGQAVIMLYHKYSWFLLLARLAGKNVEFEEADAPIVRTFSQAQVRRMFGRFKKVRVSKECVPTPTPRSGALALLYNSVAVPLARTHLVGLFRAAGFHLVIEAAKPQCNDTVTG